MESSASKDDNHFTIDAEKQKMAQTFQAINSSKDKFLPQMVQTPLSSYGHHLISPNPKNQLNQTQPSGFFKGMSPYKSKTNQKINIIDNNKNPFDYAQKIVQDYKQEELQWDEHQELERKFLVTQIPKNGSKIDFKVSPVKQFKSPGGKYKEAKVDLNTVYKVRK